MIGLLLAVMVASVLGSLHCIGMCGPLALWASGAGNRDGRVGTRLLAYHLGRLATYLTAGGIAGLAGAMLTAGGTLVGAQALASRAVGVAMIAMGLVRVADWLVPSWTGVQKSAIVASPKVPWITRFVAARRPWIARLPGAMRGVAAGALTTLLPCGWLYLFVLVAAGTGGIFPAMMIMVAFWMGTLPALSALVAGAFSVAPRLRPLLPVLGALVLLITGLYTATGRASADLSPLSERAAAIAMRSQQSSGQRTEPSSALQTLQGLQGEPLPCCVESP
jgi:sulfite exporter TauE/SafE